MRAWSVEEVCQRGDAAFERMWPMLQLYQAIAEMFYPERADFTAPKGVGDERYQEIFDEEAMLLRRDLALEFGSIMRPRGRDWAKAHAFPSWLDDDTEVREWCEDATKTQRAVMYANGANFTAAMNARDNDMVAFGASVLTHTYNSTRPRPDGLIFSCEHLRDFAWYENADGKAVEVHQKMRKSMAQLDEMGFVLPKVWLDRYKKNEHEEMEIRRCVYPVARYNQNDDVARMPARARYAVMYYAPEIREELKTKARVPIYFRTWPFLISTWTRISGEPSGRSPVTSVALATTRTLNQAQLSIIESLQKLVDPPLVVPRGMDEVRIHAGGVNYYNPEYQYGSRGPVHVVETGRPDFGMEYTDRRYSFLARAFLQNIIRFPQLTKELTAFEAQKLYDQNLRDAAPLFEPQEADMGELCEGVFERIYDAHGPGKSGGFRPPPRQLQGAEVKFQFSTLLTDAYERQAFDKAIEVTSYVATRAQAGDTSAGDHIDNDQMNRAAIKGIGTPAAWMRKEQDLGGFRDAMAKQQIAQRMGQAALDAVSKKPELLTAGAAPQAGSTPLLSQPPNG